MQQAGIAPDLAALQAKWQARVEEVLSRSDARGCRRRGYMQRGGRSGVHTEHMGVMLAEMQSVARAFPGATW